MVGMFDRTYPRNRVVLEAMRRRGITAEVCHEPSWELTRDKVRGYAGLWNRFRLVGRVIYAQVSLLVRWLTHRWEADVVWVGFPGHADMPLAWLIGKCTGRPVVFDAFISWYDSAVRDRGLFPKTSFTARMLRWFDYVACHLADRVVVDTPEHAEFFVQMFRLPERKVTWLPVGADESVFAPAEEGRRNNEQGAAARLFHVLQYAEYTPLHGGDTVLDAARLLQERSAAVRFTLVGDGGPFFEALQRRAAELGLRNVAFSGYVPEHALVEQIAAADLCLGIFGDGPKAQRVIPNKVWQCLAMAKPVVTADTPAVRRVFEPGRDLVAVPPGDAGALADAVTALAADPVLRDRLAAQGHQRFVTTCSIDAIAERLDHVLHEAVARRRAASEAVAEATRPA